MPVHLAIPSEKVKFVNQQVEMPPAATRFPVSRNVRMDNGRLNRNHFMSESNGVGVSSEIGSAGAIKKTRKEFTNTFRK